VPTAGVWPSAPDEPHAINTAQQAVVSEGATLFMTMKIPLSERITPQLYVSGRYSLASNFVN
jgi:hypothetical protein